MSYLKLPTECSNELDRARSELGALAVMLGQIDSLSDGPLDGVASMLTGLADTLDTIAASLIRDPAAIE